MILRAIATFAVLVFSTGVVSAQQFAPGAGVSVRTTTVLNLRNGPGIQYPVLIRIPAGRAVPLLGCVPGFRWCRTSYLGRVGWVSAAYLTPRPGLARFPPGPPFPAPGPFPPGFPFPPQPFPPGQQPGLVTVHGTLTNEGVECPAMRSDSGRLYTLTGGIGGFRPGNRVNVRGRIAQVSICQQGTTIQVQSIRPG